MTTDRFTVYPPDYDGPIEDGYRCNNESEWVASHLNKDDRCWFRKKYGGFQMGDWTPATFIFAWFYDGVIAEVYEDDPDDFIKRVLFLDLGDELRAEAP
jgi:hypothetical protein